MTQVLYRLTLKKDDLAYSFHFRETDYTEDRKLKLETYMEMLDYFKDKTGITPNAVPRYDISMTELAGLLEPTYEKNLSTFGCEGFAEPSVDEGFVLDARTTEMPRNEFESFFTKLKAVEAERDKKEKEAFIRSILRDAETEEECWMSLI
jgi:hypothetical protein